MCPTYSLLMRGVLQEQSRARLVCATQQIASAKLIQLHVRRKRTHRMTPVSPLTLRYSAIPSSNTRVGVKCRLFAVMRGHAYRRSPYRTSSQPWVPSSLDSRFHNSASVLRCCLDSPQELPWRCASGQAPLCFALVLCIWVAMCARQPRKNRDKLRVSPRSSTRPR